MEIQIRCDRCGAEFKGSKTEHFTGGYYDLSNPDWKKLADGKDTEFIICDNCMFKSPKYIKEYGQHAPHQGE